MSVAAAIPAAVPGAGAGDRVELDNRDDAECEPPPPKKPRNAARPWAQELDETEGKGALQKMGRKQATIIWKAGSRLQKILDKSGGGPGLGGTVSIAVFKAPVKLAGTHMTQQFTKSRGAPFDQTGYYVLGDGSIATQDAYKSLGKAAYNIKAGGALDAPAATQQKYQVFWRTGAAAHRAPQASRK